MTRTCAPLDAADGLIEELDALRPPAEVAEANAALVDALGESQAIRRDVVDAQRDGDEAAVERLMAKEPSTTTRDRVLEARKTFARLGYDLGGLAEADGGA